MKITEGHNGSRFLLKPGEYMKVNSDGAENIVLACGNCGKPAELDHEISFNLQGEITIQPSVVCAYDCGWHVWIKDGLSKDC